MKKEQYFMDMNQRQGRAFLIPIGRGFYSAVGAVQWDEHA